MRIVDVSNEVANSFPTSAADIGEGLQRSAAALSAAGNSLEESVAIFTASQAIAQDADTVGTSLKTMSMRIRSTKSEMEAAGEDTEGMAESVSKLRDEIKSLAGVDIMLDDETYKSTYQILDELAQVWDKLNDITQANVLELLFGKRQANIGSGLLENFDIARDALKTALDAEGSALKENEVFLESIQGHLNKLSAAWETFSYDFLDSEFVKGVIDFLTKVVNLLDDITNSIGPIPTLIAACFAAFGAAKGAKLFGAFLKDNPAQKIKDLVEAFNRVRAMNLGLQMVPANESVEALTKSLQGLKAALPLLGALTPLFVVLAAAIPYLKQGSWKSNAANVNSAKSEYEEAADKIQEYSDKVADNEERIKELTEAKKNSKLPLVEDQEIQQLKDENEQLEKQKELYEEIAQTKKENLYYTTRQAVENTFGYTRDGYKSSSISLLDSPANLQDKIDELNEWIQQAEERGDTWSVNYFEKVKTKFEVKLAEVKEQLLDWYNILIESTDPVDRALAEQIWSAIYNIPGSLSELLQGEQFSGIFDFLKKNADATLEDLRAEFGNNLVDALLGSLSGFGIEWDQFAAYLRDAYGETKDDIENNPIEVNADVTEAMEAVEKLSSSFKTLSNAFKEQAENGSLSIDTILDIIDAGYAAALSIDKETGAVRLNTQVYIALAKAKIQEQIASLQSRRAEIVAGLTAEAKAAGAAAMAHLELAIASNESIKGLDSAIAALTALNNSDLSTVTSGLYGVSSAASSAKSQLSSLLSGMNSLLSTTMDWLRQSYEDSNNATKEWLKSHKEALEKQLDDYNDLIDAQIELLERQKEADDYAKKRKDKEKTVSDIENQLVAIENDDSIEAQKKRLELQEELAKAKDDLAEVQDDWNYDQRKQALEDEKQKYQDLIQAEIDAVQKRLDAVNSATISEMELRQQAYDWITNREEELYQNLIAWNREYGDGLDATIDNLFKDADGWRAYGATFKEALENLTRLAHDAQDATGGVSAAVNTVVKSIDDLIAKIREAADAAAIAGDTIGQKMLDSIANSLERMKELSVEMSEETSQKLYDLLNNCDDITRNMIMNMLSRFGEMKKNGVAEFDELWGRFIQDVMSADSSLFNGGSNMLANLQELWKALMQVRAEAEQVAHYYDGVTDTRYTGAGKSGKAYETLTPYANGGVIDYTGPAMVHGKSSSPEVVFNAEAASKLFNYVTQTPNLIAAALAQGSGMLKGYGSVSASLTGGDMGDININIAGNADASTVNELKRVAAGIKDDVIKTLNDSLRRRGITRSPRTV